MIHCFSLFIGITNNGAVQKVRLAVHIYSYFLFCCFTAFVKPFHIEGYVLVFHAKSTAHRTKSPSFWGRGFYERRAPAVPLPNIMQPVRG